MLASLLIAGPALATPADDALFEKIFKKKRSEVPATVTMPVYFENGTTEMGQIKTQVTQDLGELLLESGSIRKYIGMVVQNPQPYTPIEVSGADLKNPDTNTQWVPISSFKLTGYRVEYDKSKLELRIRVPPELRRIRALSLTRGEDETRNDPNLEPRFFSTYLNINGAQDFTISSIPGVGGRMPVRGQFENGTNFGGLVFESSASFLENQYNDPKFQTWTRGDIRAVHDTPSLMLRQTAGDLNYPIRGFQAFRAMGGVTVASQFGLQPNRLTVPTGEQELLLKRNSKVSIYNNDRLVKTLDLPAGRHDLRDFPFISGPNDMRIEIVDDLGRVENMNMSYFSNSDLLAPGLHQVSYSVGVPSDDAAGTRRYDSNHMAASAFHRVGLTDWLTIGANGQGNKNVIMGGTEMTFSSGLGAFKLEPAISSIKTGTRGFAFRSRYTFLDYAGENHTQRSFGLGWETRSPDFTPLADIPQVNPTQHDITFLYSQTISDRTMGNASLEYQINRITPTSTSNGYRAALGLSRSWANGLSINANVQQAQNALGISEASVALFLNWSLTKEHQVITASYDMRDDSTRVDWNYTPSEKTGGTNARVGIKKDTDKRGFDGAMTYTGNRGIVTLSDDSSWAGASTSPNSAVSAQLGTAIVFAGGSVALSRPVTDSFVIVDPRKALRGQKLEINPTSDHSYSATTDWLGAAAMSDLSSYNPTPVIIGTSNLKAGLSVDQDHFLVYPTYKSGYNIKLGSDANLSVAANFLNPDGSPIATQPGRIRSLSDPSWTTITVFTGRTGKMRGDGLKPGKYEFSFFEENWEPYTFDVPENADTLVELGKVRLNVRKH